MFKARCSIPLRCPWCGRRYSIVEATWEKKNRFVVCLDHHVQLLTKFQWDAAFVQGALTPAFEVDNGPTGPSKELKS